MCLCVGVSVCVCVCACVCVYIYIYICSLMSLLLRRNSVFCLYAIQTAFALLVGFILWCYTTEFMWKILKDGHNKKFGVD